VPTRAKAVLFAVPIVVVAARMAAPQSLLTELTIVERASGLHISNDPTDRVGGGNSKSRIQNSKFGRGDLCSSIFDLRLIHRAHLQP
jgi:hypothetical protein